MQCSADYIDYKTTGYFSKIVTDYISAEPALLPFYKYSPDIAGIHAAIDYRKNFPVDRQILVQQLLEQYNNLPTSEALKHNITALLSEDTFTVCTAHQPNIFTGHLYLVYKVVHAIKLAKELKNHFPTKSFVPVFYMGSEDADLEELGHIFLNNEKLTWNTKQIGAVGRMKIDDQFLSLLSSVKGMLSVLPNGNDLIKILEDSYKKGSTLQQATLILLNTLFASYGLVILITDNPLLKKQMHAVFEDDLFNNRPFTEIQDTNKKLEQHYKGQAHPRLINLFYLKDDIRNRIEKHGNEFQIEGTTIRFSEADLRTELFDHPERFSPNVIIRGLFQEKILPNVAFIGGGGEIAYWLQTKKLFELYNIPFPVLIMRNSFMLIEKKTKLLLDKLNLTTFDIFQDEIFLIKQIINQESTNDLSLEKQKKVLQNLYTSIQQQLSSIDKSLHQHTEALMTKNLNQLTALEKKMFRAEKRKQTEKLNQLKKLQYYLFPTGELQERVENFLPYYARYGKQFFKIIDEFSGTTEQQFCILKISEE
ncbi:bacillithiol biosynthesis cysteine-adding enzyme BshC [soil metagenome]